MLMFYGKSNRPKLGFRDTSEIVVTRWRYEHEIFDVFTEILVNYTCTKTDLEWRQTELLPSNNSWFFRTLDSTWIVTENFLMLNVTRKRSQTELQSLLDGFV